LDAPVDYVVGDVTHRVAVRWLYIKFGWLHARQAGDVQNLQTADE
jgi:hypothetical protein